ncbi:MAG: hypothetical protein PHR82_01600 [Endomicrobiaceae bacterium]|nr:hypothetical protein [Endomicrobiaceae bacterium]
MKRNIIILSLISFFVTAGLSYFIVEMLYKNNLKQSLNYLKDYSVSIVDSLAPEIKTSFSKSDDIGLLYSINKLSKFKNITESFILNKDLIVVIDNDSSKWNKKYPQSIYQNAVSAKSNLLATFPDFSGFLYSIPIDDTNTLCAIISAQNISAQLNGWKIKLYVFSFIVSLILAFFIYYLSKILFLIPFNKTKKSLSLKDKMPKTIYSQLIDMVMVDVSNLSNDLNAINDTSNLSKQLLAYVTEKYMYIQYEVFAVLDSNAKIIYCIDKNNILFGDKNINTHVFNATNNAVIIKNISTVLEKQEKISFSIDDIAINVIPVKNQEKTLIGIVIEAIKIQEIRNV